MQGLTQPSAAADAAAADAAAGDAAVSVAGVAVAAVAGVLATRTLQPYVLTHLLYFLYSSTYSHTLPTLLTRCAISLLRRLYARALRARRGA